MPPLVNLPSPIFLSRTDPPFLYQYVGDQVKVIQVLGNDNEPLCVNINKETNDNTDHRDQTKTAAQEESQKDYVENEDKSNKTNDIIPETSNTEIDKKIIDNTVQVESNDNNNNNLSISIQQPLPVGIQDISPELKNETLEKEIISIEQKTVKEDQLETTSLDTSINDNESAESDDEASYGTPEDSPKAKRKSPKGKYGKGKAPAPPKLEMPKDITEQDGKSLDSAVSTTSLESLNDIINIMPNTTFKESGEFKAGLQVVNPIAEKKRRHKSKSPGRIPKSHVSGISKLLQIPNKLAFWQKSDDKSKADGISTSSEDHSRRSSTIEKQADDYQSCFELNLENTKDAQIPQEDVSDDQNSFMDACDADSEIVIANEIIEKSDALQKLIEAKIESHPEYKFVSLHDEIPTTSKSTDV